MSDYLLQIYNLISKRTITEVGILFSYLNHHYREFDCDDYLIIRKLLKDLEESYLDNDLYLLYDINNNFQSEYQLLLLKSLEDEIKEYDKKKQQEQKQQEDLKDQRDKNNSKKEETNTKKQPNKKKSYAAITKKSITKKNNDSDDEIII